MLLWVLVSGIWVGWWSRPEVVWVSAWGGVVWCGSSEKRKEEEKRNEEREKKVKIK